MGFLDKKSRVVDFVLTERGKRLFAVGQLDFAYFAVFDDGIDYSVSGSEHTVQDVLMMECPNIKETRGIDSPLEPRYNLFTAAANSLQVPHPVIHTGSLVLRCEQLREDGKYRRFKGNRVAVDLSLSPGAEAGDQGFSVRLFSSGSSGIHESSPRRDLSGRRVFDPFVAVAVDEQDDPSGRRRR